MHHYACCQLWAVMVFHTALQHLGIGGEPLLLTPLLDKNDIPAALRLSEVKDPNSIIPRSYAGFITADRQLGNHLFFWFFPAISQPNAPLVVWLNGGPGISSMFGLLGANGPIRVKALDDDHVTYERREKSWAETFSMLYIDNPVGVGYSYSDNGTMGFRTTQDGYAGDLYSFIEQFYVMFPEYLKRELYIGGQSYAGKYVPAFAHRIHKEILAKRSSIPLTGIYLLGPYFDPEIQSVAFGDYYYALGVISYSELTKFKKDIAQVFEDYRNSPHALNFETIFNQVFPLSIHRDYSLDNYVTMELPDYDSVKIFMNMQMMRDMLHVGDLIYSISSRQVNSKLKPDFLTSTKAKLAELMDTYKILVANGDYDGLITSVMVDSALLATPWSRQAEYNASTRSVWRTGSEQVHGFYSRVGQFCRVVIHGAGHQIPVNQPDSSRDMMVKFVQSGCI